MRPDPRRHSLGRKARGFTLIELVIVIVITGVIAATIAVFFRPAIDSWFAVRARAELSDQASTALGVMQRDVRLAVPNSIRTAGSACFELIPTSAGGRFRKVADTTVATSLPLDLTAATTVFDVLSPLSAAPSPGDWIVIDNQNPGDVYAGGTNRAALSAIVTTPLAGVYASRITLASAFVDPGYQGGRLLVVPDAQQAVSYVCSGADGTLDANGDGKGTLTRYAHYGFVASYPTTCAAPNTGASGMSAAVVATRVKSCGFVYDPNQGATQQSGFVSMQLELARNGEVVSLLMGAHVVNVP